MPSPANRSAGSCIRPTASACRSPRSCHRRPTARRASSGTGPRASASACANHTRYNPAAMKQTLLALTLIVTVAAPALSQGGSCDRSCLNRIADAYIAALVAHDPSKAPLAPGVKFTEQAQVLAVGEGLWKTAI